MRASYIRYGIKEFERNIFFNIFIILQISAALILIVYCVSSINYISKFYSPIKEHIDGEGICSIDITNYPLLEEISGFEYVDEVYSFNSVGGLYNNSNAFYKNDIRYVYINSYDDKFINDYIPILEKGKWLSECDSEDGIINAVISYNDEYEVGDVITVVFDPQSDCEKELNFKIVGMLCDGAKVFNAYTLMSEVSDASSLYPNYYSAQHKNEILLLTEKNQKLGGCPGMSLIKFKEGRSDEEYENFTTQLGADFDIKGIKLSKINETSLKQINEQRVMILPLIIGISILIFTSILSMSAISTNRQLKNYGIYSISGGTRAGCVLIQMCNVLCCCIFSCFLAYLFFNILKISGKLNGSIVAFGTNEFCSCAAWLIITIIVSSVMPILIIGKKKIKDMLREMEL